MAGRNHHIPGPPPPRLDALIAEESRRQQQQHMVPRHQTGAVDIQGLLIDNQRLAAAHVALKQDLAVARQELRQLSAVAADVKAERDAEVRDVYERTLKMEAEVRGVEGAGEELGQVRADVKKLAALKQDLTAQLQAIRVDFARATREAQDIPALIQEIQIMHRELHRGRAAIEYEKKQHVTNLEQSQAMEKNMFSVAREIEKLHAELANAEKRARAAAAAAANPSPTYAANYGNPDTSYGPNSYPDPYGMHQVQSGGDPFGSGAAPHGPHDVQQAQIQ